MIRALAFLLLLAGPAACWTTCVELLPQHAKEAMTGAAAVFRGTVIESTLSMRADMVARRYVTRFRVNEYWKGYFGEILTLHDTQFSPTLDCGRPAFEPGKEYLVYAVEESPEDVSIQEFERKYMGAQDPRIRFVRGWTDLVPRGARILARSVGTGEATNDDVRRCIQVLGTGRPGVQGQSLRPSTISERAHQILEEARAQRVEVFADVTFLLLDKLAKEDKKAALKEVFERAGGAHNRLPLRYAQGSASSMLDLGLVRDRANKLKLDALSLRSRAIQALLKIDPATARKLADQIPAIESPKSECKDEFVPDSGAYQEMLAAVVEQGEFTKQEREKQAPWMMVESAAHARSSWEIAAAAKALPRLARTEREAQILSVALAQDLGFADDSDRGFTSALRTGELVKQVLEANTTLHAAGAEEILPAALRAFIVRQLKAVRCKDNLSVSPARDAAIFNDAVRGRNGIAPLALEETEPAGVGDEIRKSAYQNGAQFSALWNEINALGPTGTRNFSAARLTAEWGFRADQALARILDWEGDYGQDSVSLFHQKIAMLHLLIDMAPAGQAHRAAMKETIRLLGNATVLEASPSEWLSEVRFVVDYFQILAPLVQTAGAMVEGFAYTSGNEIWQGFADSKLAALSLYGRIGLLNLQESAVPPPTPGTPLVH